MCNPTRPKKVNNVFEHIIKIDNRKSFIGELGVLPADFDTSWVEDPTVWSSIASQSGDAKRIYLNGGEPLLAKHHEKILAKLIETGAAKDISLIYSSNCLLLDESHVELWRHFGHVSVSFSIDDLDERNHFIRNPSNWASVVKSLDLVKSWQMDPANASVKIEIWCAINILNFAYLSEYLQFFATSYPSIKISGWRAIQSPPYLNPANLPDEIKERYGPKILAAVDANDLFAHLRGDIEMIIEARPDETLLDDGMAFMKMNADFYQIDLPATFPKLAHLM